MKIILSKDNFQQAKLASTGYDENGKVMITYFQQKSFDVTDANSLLGYTNKQIQILEEKIKNNENVDANMARIFGMYCYMVTQYNRHYKPQKKDKMLRKLDNIEYKNYKNFKNEIEVKYNFSEKLVKQFKELLDGDIEKDSYTLEDDSTKIVYKDKSNLSKDQSIQANKDIKEQKDIEDTQVKADIEKEEIVDKDKSKLPNEQSNKENNELKEHKGIEDTQVKADIKKEEIADDLSKLANNKKEDIVEKLNINIEDDAIISAAIKEEKKIDQVNKSKKDKLNFDERIVQDNIIIDEIVKDIKDNITSNYSVSNSKIADLVESTKDVYKDQDLITKFTSNMTQLDKDLNLISRYVRNYNNKISGLEQIIGDYSLTIKDRKDNFENYYQSDIIDKGNQIKSQMILATNNALSLYVATKSKINKRGFLSKLFNKAKHRQEDTLFNDLKSKMKNSLGFTDNDFELIDKFIKSPKIDNHFMTTCTKNSLDTKFIEKLEAIKLSSLIDISINKVKQVDTKFKVTNEEIEKARNIQKESNSIEEIAPVIKE